MTSNFGDHDGGSAAVTMKRQAASAEATQRRGISLSGGIYYLFQQLEARGTPDSETAETEDQGKDRESCTVLLLTIPCGMRVGKVQRSATESGTCTNARARRQILPRTLNNS